MKALKEIREELAGALDGLAVIFVTMGGLFFSLLSLYLLVHFVKWAWYH